MARTASAGSNQTPNVKPKMKQENSTKQTKAIIPEQKLVAEWRAKNLTPYNGKKGTAPQSWPMYKGNLPHASTAHWHDKTCWPRNVVLYSYQIDRVLKRFARPDFPRRIKLDMVRTYVRNFDSEGYVIKSSHTSGRDWTSLPVRHEDAPREVIVIEEDGPQQEREQAGDKNDNTSVQADTARSTGSCTGSETMGITGQAQIEVIPDATDATGKDTNTESATANLYEHNDKAVKDPTDAAFPADMEADFARLLQPIRETKMHSDRVSSVREPRESSTASRTTDQSYGSTTGIQGSQSKSPAKQKNLSRAQGLSRLGKRLAESADLRQEVKRLRAENNQKSETIKTLEEEAGDYKEKMRLQQTERAAIDEKSRSLEHDNGVWQARLKICKHETAILRSALGKSLYNWDYLDQKFGRDFKQDDEQEEDCFLEGLNAELGTEEFNRLLELGRMSYHPK